MLQAREAFPEIIHDGCSIRKPRIRQDDGEFLTAVSPDRVALSQPLAQQARQRLENVVADQVTEGIVDLLKMSMSIMA